MICKKCGNQIPDDAGFCGKCGAAVNLDAKIAEEASLSKSVKSGKRKVPVWVFGIVAVGVIGIIIAAIVFILSTGFHLKHEWAEATCTEPRTCVVGGETEGNALGHIWVEATCTEARTCSVCGETEGEALGHEWMEATCALVRTCSVCGETEGKSLGHDWLPATCQTPQTCSRCGITVGKLKDHSAGTPATYWSAAVCKVCGNTFGKALTPYFDKHGIDINAFPGNSYETEWGTFTFDYYNKEQNVDYTLVSGSGSVKSQYLSLRMWCWMEDYYTGAFYENKKNDDDSVTLVYTSDFSVNYKGREYDDCYGEIRYSAAGTEFYFYYELNIPTGYDGCVLYMGDNGNGGPELRLKIE